MRQESEHIERMALAELHAAAPQGIADRLKLWTTEIGGALLSVAGALPASAIVVNRALGFNAESEQESLVRQIRDVYSESGVKRFFLSIDPDIDNDAAIQGLEAAGMQAARAWQKFSRGREAVPEVATELVARHVGAEHGEAFGRIVADAFDLGSEAASWLAALAGSDGWHLFMAFAGDQPAGAGALYIRDGLAWSDFGATLPAYRRRGSQGALLALRLQFALDNGCHRIFTCTGEAAAGDEQHSYRNILRLGFRKDYLRANYQARTN